MTLAQWHKTFMPPFHTLISDVICSLFCLDREFDTVTVPLGFSPERRGAAVRPLHLQTSAADSNLRCRTENLYLNQK